MAKQHCTHAPIDCGSLCRLLSESAAERQWLDPHALLALEQAASEKPAVVKKAFWRLSLLIHPDKCQHPRANDAFQAVTKAAEALQVSIHGLATAAAIFHFLNKVFLAESEFDCVQN